MGPAMIVVGIAVSLSTLVVQPEALAQSAQNAHRIGLLCYLSCPNATSKQFVDLLVAIGYVPGRNTIIEYRHADGKSDRFPQAAQELIDQNVDVIVSFTTPGTRAAQKATSSVPIVFATGADPVAVGFVKSIEKPGGNLTGVTEEAPDLAAKRVALLKEIVPRAKKFGILWEGSSYGTQVTREMAEKAALAVRASGVEAEVIEVKVAADYEAAFASLVRAQADSVLIEPTTLVVAEAQRIAGLAASNMLPVLWPGTLPQLIRAGGLLMMGADLADVYPRAASIVDKILKGTKPTDLPVAHTEKFKIIVNKKVAADLGLTIPASLLARADQIIE